MILKSMSKPVEGIFEDLKRDEGFRSKTYTCTAGKFTIGYGKKP